MPRGATDDQPRRSRDREVTVAVEGDLATRVARARELGELAGRAWLAGRWEPLAPPTVEPAAIAPPADQPAPRRRSRRRPQPTQEHRP